MYQCYISTDSAIFMIVAVLNNRLITYTGMKALTFFWNKMDWWHYKTGFKINIDLHLCLGAGISNCLLIHSRLSACACACACVIGTSLICLPSLQCIISVCVFYASIYFMHSCVSVKGFSLFAYVYQKCPPIGACRYVCCLSVEEHCSLGLRCLWEYQ